MCVLVNVTWINACQRDVLIKYSFGSSNKFNGKPMMVMVGEKTWCHLNLYKVYIYCTLCRLADIFRGLLAILPINPTHRHIRSEGGFGGVGLDRTYR